MGGQATHDQEPFNGAHQPPSGLFYMMLFVKYDLLLLFAIPKRETRRKKVYLLEAFIPSRSFRDGPDCGLLMHGGLQLKPTTFGIFVPCLSITTASHLETVAIIYLLSRSITFLCYLEKMFDEAQFSQSSSDESWESGLQSRVVQDIASDFCLLKHWYQLSGVFFALAMLFCGKTRR